jgi:hypothetical protein
LKTSTKKWNTKGSGNETTVLTKIEIAKGITSGATNHKNLLQPPRLEDSVRTHSNEHGE